MIFKRTDKVHYKILTKFDVWVRPLDVHEKDLITELMGKAATNIKFAHQAARLGVSMALRNIKGLPDEDENGNEIDYKLEFNTNGYLTNDCLSDLLNHEISNELVNLCGLMMNNVPTVFKDDKGKALKSIKYIGKNDMKLGKK